ncbi:MAG: methionyl-tRNA formyltransferase [Chloroflexaceae bacterium]|nr:methionyl-tRNA formyltransferase [Chloroflexaceae bacterium]NJO06676.1 methionyl-tRNA formyltransferase [Chloroflexaceae bacterium]
MRILYMGSPSFAVLPLEALVQAGHEIVAVVTQPDRPAGRKRMPSPPPVKEAAQRLGLPILQPATLRDATVVQQLADLRPDVGVIAAYGEILRKNVLAIPPLGYLNIHPSLLPRYRGPAPVTGAILAGDTETGVSIMLLDPGMDSGPILAQEVVPLPPDARAGPFTDRMFELGTCMLVDVLPRYAAGDITPQPQDDARATITRFIEKSDGAVDWHLPAAAIERRIRAYDPWPGVFTQWRGQPLKLLDAVVHPNGQGQPGAIQTQGGALLVVTGAGTLELQHVQPAGKRPMSGAAWLNGQRDAVGLRFGE